MTSTPSPSPVPPATGWRARAAAGVAAAPERLVLIGVATSVAAGLAVSVGAHTWWTVLPGAVLLIVLGWRPLAPRPAGGRADAVGAGIAVAGSAAWSVLGIAMAAEYMLVVRDPGFLTLSGLWLVDHPSTDIPAMGATDAAAASPTALADASEAWNLEGDTIQPQGAKLLPAVIAIGGWFAGDSGVLGANVLVGALGILAVYAVARRFLGPLAALAPAGALALSVAHIGLSRPAYSEPLTLLLAVAGVLWAWRGVAQGSVALMVAAGVASGAATFARIDGTAVALGLAAGVVAAAWLARGEQRRAASAGLAFLVAQAATVAAGLASVAIWSTAYLERLADRAIALHLGYAAAIAVAALALALLRSPLGARSAGAFTRTVAPRLATPAAVAVGVVLAALASRPLWTTVHRGVEDDRAQFTNGVVESFQAAQGLPIDPTRTYAESTVTWLSYYLTWPLVILGCAGLALAAHRMLRRDGTWAVLLATVLAPTLLYLWNPSIVPDQIWAIRRFLPITIPGIALAAAVAAWALADQVRGRAPRQAARRTAAVAMIALPLTTWISVVPGDARPLSTAVNATTREMVGARDQLAALCALDPGRPIVLVGTSEHFGSLRVMCDVPVVLELGQPTAAQLVAMADAWGASPLVLTRSRDAVPWAQEPTVVVESEVRHSSYTLQALPRSLYTRTYRWLAGTVQADGTVVPLTPP